MRTFTLYLRDDRYAVPTLAFVHADDEGAALVLALKRLGESPHHTAIEVLEGDTPLFRVPRAN